jgi:uncharacterized protein (TIGR03083 family)
MTREQRAIDQTTQPEPGSMSPSAVDYLAAIRQEAAAISAAASLGLTTPNLPDPGWTLLDLITHTGGVHRWVTALVRDRSQERIPRHSYVHEMPPDHAIGWFETGVRELMATLESVDPETAVWSLSDDRTAAFWHRRMAHETAVHRWDAQLANGVPLPIEPDLAVSALGESLDIYATRRLAGHDISGSGETVLLRCADRPAGWRLAFQSSALQVEPLASANGTADAEISAGASDLWLFVMGRLPISTLEATGGRSAIRLLVHVLSLMTDALL